MISIVLTQDKYVNEIIYKNQNDFYRTKKDVRK